MNCLTDEMLRRSIDGELSAEESARVGGHLGVCEDCRTREARTASQALEVRNMLAALRPAESESPMDPREAYTRFRQNPVPRPNAYQRWFDVALGVFWKKSLGGVLAAAVVLAFLISFAPARGWSQKILEMLRVQKLALVPIDISAFEANANGQRSAGKLLTQLISDSVVVTMKPGEPEIATDPTVAGQMAGFAVRTLNSLGSPQKILVQGEAAFHATLNRERMEDLLTQVGRSDIQIPVSADGSTIAVHTSKMVRLVYGNCKGERDTKQDPASGTCVSFMQSPSPAVSLPPNLDVPALAEAALEAGGMSAADAHAFSRTVDWSSTLVIPVPDRGSSVRTVAVDGVTGNLIETAPRGRFPGSYNLLWLKNGMVYSLHGSGDADQALAAAAALD
jgi:hypothetical protein